MLPAIEEEIPIAVKQPLQLSLGPEYARRGILMMINDALWTAVDEQTDIGDSKCKIGILEIGRREYWVKPTECHKQLACHDEASGRAIIRHMRPIGQFDIKRRIMPVERPAVAPHERAGFLQTSVGI